jgi:asparagine synthase (glutamine-hydrolysing)
MKTFFQGNFDSLENIKQFGSTTFNGNDGVNVWFWGKIYNMDVLNYPNCTDVASFLHDCYTKQDLLSFNKLDGSFTFIISTPKELVIGRDHHGTNLPVYYSATAFASSLLLLTETKGFDRKPDFEALGTFLNSGYIPTPRTAFLNVQKLGAGMLLTFQKGKTSLLNLFETRNIQPVLKTASLEELSEEYGRLHMEAIQRRIKNKENVGILLSGGYDSGSNLSAIRQIYNGVIHSFSIGFKGNIWTELPLARCMSDTFQTIHSEYEIDGTEISALPEIVRFLGDPFVEGGLMVNYTVMKMVSENRPDIILGGDGSDQYFGTSGREIAIHHLLAKSGMMPVAKLLHTVINRKAFDNNNHLYRVNFQLDKIIGVMNGDFFGLPNFRLHEMLMESSKTPTNNIQQIAASTFEHLYTRHLYETDIEKTINQVILFKASRMAEMFDNSITFPFMDHTLYEFLQQLPVNLKYHTKSLKEAARGNATTKFLLKHHFKPLLPTEITSKKKQGGFAPMPLFFADKKRRDRIAEYILASGIISNFLKREKVEQFIQQYDIEANDKTAWFWYRQNRAIQYFNLYTLAIWWEIFMTDGKK